KIQQGLTGFDPPRNKGAHTRPCMREEPISSKSASHNTRMEDWPPKETAVTRTLKPLDLTATRVHSSKKVGFAHSAFAVPRASAVHAACRFSTPLCLSV
ncbi:hypothetical protein CSUI_008308, partial [Cystoisospora suis]